MTDGGADARSGHLPVMFGQVMEGLRVVGDGTYLDGTFGRGGHARGVLERLCVKKCIRPLPPAPPTKVLTLASLITAR